MPVTAKLSKAFYERLGENIANELVDWFNQVDATYRSDLRELNELNFARFDAKLEQRIAELRSTLREELVELRATLRQEIAELRTELKGEIAGLRTALKREIAGLRTEVKGEIAGLRTDIKGDVADVRDQVGAVENRLLTWMFAAWATTIGTLITLLRLWG